MAAQVFALRTEATGKPGTHRHVAILAGGNNACAFTTKTSAHVHAAIGKR